MASKGMLKFWKVSSKLKQIWISRGVHGMVGPGTGRHIQKPSTWVLYSLSTDSSRPSLPKRPINSYLLFINEKRAAIISQHPNASVTEIVKQAAQMYRDLPDSQKQQYLSTFQSNMAEYKIKYENYLSSLTDDQKKQIKSAKQDKLKKKSVRKLKKKMVVLNRPQLEATSGYILYMLDRKSDRGTTPITIFIKQIAKDWSSMPDATKQPYLDKAKAAQDRNQRKLENWEKKMIKEGHFDVVRKSQRPKPMKVVSTKKPKKVAKSKKSVTSKKSAKKVSKTVKKSLSKSKKSEV